MANNNSMSFNIDGSPSEKRRIIDDETLQRLRPLVSIDYVRVNNIIPEDTNEMDRKYRYMEEFDIEMGILRHPLCFGAVTVTDCLRKVKGTLRVSRQYGVDCGVHLPMPLPHQILLENPLREISGNDSFIISVNLWVLWHAGDAGDIVKEIARGEIVWDPYTRDPLPYNKPLQQDVLGRYGCVTVGYSVIREALSATIDVVWMHESNARICGAVRAVRSLGGSSTTRMLFHRSTTCPEDVVAGRSIFNGLFSDARTFPFPVPVDSHLTIEVDLWDRSSPDQSILGIAQFTPQIGTQETIITSKYGKVRVSFTCK